jgi:hypothetical protein
MTSGKPPFFVSSRKGARGFLLFLTALSIAAAFGRADEAKREISVKEIQEGKVSIIGELGLELMTVAQIEAVVVSGEDFGKFFSSDLLLSIVSVNGRRLPNPVVLPFSAASAGASFAPKKANIGKSYALLAYETGFFSGVPKLMPKDYPIGQDRGAGFYTSLKILREGNRR